MKIILCSFAICLLTWLTPACSLKGHAQNDTVETGAPQSVPAVGASEAKSEPERAQQRVGTLFRGGIEQAKFEMDLKRDGSTLSGSYYYLRSGPNNRLTLKGTIAA